MSISAATIGCSLIMCLTTATVIAQDVPQATVVDASRIAVQLSEPDRAVDLAVRAAVFNIQVAHAEPFGPAGFHVLELAEPLEDADERRTALASLVESGEVEFATPVRLTDDGLLTFPTRFILLRFEEATPQKTQYDLLERVPGLRIERENFGGMSNAYRLISSSRTGDDVLDEVDQLAKLPGVRWVESDAVSEVRVHHVPNDPFFVNCWGLQNTGFNYNAITYNCCTNASVTGVPGMDMDAAGAWDLQTGSNNIIVVVFDGGVDQGHVDINQRAGSDFTSDPITTGGPFSACDNHGTAVAGCVSAIIDNNCGTVGVAPGCRVASARVSTASTLCVFSFMSSWYVNALDWAESIGARVSNASLSFSYSAAISDKYYLTTLNGMVHFAAAGNGCSSSIVYPASDGSVLGVGALNADGTLACFSNTGALFCTAPGVNIQTTDRTGAAGYNNGTSSCTAATSGDYTVQSGTSFASPYAAGVAALVLSQDPGLGPAPVAEIIQRTCVDLGATGYDSSFGYGLVRARAAVECAGDVYADPNVVPGGTGSYYFPFQSLTAAAAATPTDGHLVLRAGNYDQTPEFDTAMTLTACNGDATIGE